MFLLRRCWGLLKNNPSLLFLDMPITNRVESVPILIGPLFPFQRAAIVEMYALGIAGRMALGDSIRINYASDKKGPFILRPEIAGPAVFRLVASTLLHHGGEITNESLSGDRNTLRFALSA